MTRIQPDEDKVYIAPNESPLDKADYFKINLIDTDNVRFITENMSN